MSSIPTPSALWLCLLTLMGCAGERDPPRLSSTSAEECASELKWTSGDQGSPLMKPGSDCLGCHRVSSSAPTLLLAGTVYASNQAQEGCAGVPEVTIEVEDQAGQRLELISNQAGNFFLLDDGVNRLVTPYRVSVRYDGRALQMQEETFSGSCAECHSGPSASRASARVTIPQ